jgi:hypothetical protein
MATATIADKVFLKPEGYQTRQLAKKRSHNGDSHVVERSAAPLPNSAHNRGRIFRLPLEPGKPETDRATPRRYWGITSVGNSSLSGASLAMLNQKFERDGASCLSSEVLDLSSHPDFRDHFISHLDFAPAEESAVSALG